MLDIGYLRDWVPLRAPGLTLVDDDWWMTGPVSQVFRSKRTRFASFLGGGFFMFLGIVLLYRLLAEKHPHIDFGLTLGLGIAELALCGAWLARAPWAGTAQIRDSHLVYRSLLKTRHIPLADIASIESTSRQQGGRDCSVPRITFRQGNYLWLSEFAVPVRNELDNADLVERINRSLRRC